MNVFLLFGIIIGVIILISLLDEFIRHRKAEKAMVGKNYARLSDFGIRDHYLLKRLWKTVSRILVFIVCIALYFSIIIVFLQSVNASKDITSWSGFTFKWYIQMFTNRSLNKSIIHTLEVSALATLCSTVFGTLASIGMFYSSKKVRSHIMLLNNIPMLNADIVTGISIMLIFSFLVNIDPYVFGLRTMLLAHVYFCMPYVILNVLNKLKDLDPNLVDASFDLGLNPLKTLGKVIIPAAKSGIFAGLIMAFTLSYDDFIISYYTTGNGFDNLSIWIYSSIGRKSLSPVVYSFSVLVIFICLIFIFLRLMLQKKQKKGKKHA